MGVGSVLFNTITFLLILKEFKQVFSCQETIDILQTCIAQFQKSGNSDDTGHAQSKLVTITFSSCPLSQQVFPEVVYLFSLY